MVSVRHEAAEKVLRRFLHCAGQDAVASEFMMMGAVVIDCGATVHLYKHIDTRRLLALDTSGHAFAVARRITSPMSALQDVACGKHES